MQGRKPKPTSIRIAEGMRGHRPLPENEPQYSPGVPAQPKGMSGGARRVWDALVFEMAPSRVLRTVDGFALAQLCEDQAQLDVMRRGLATMARELSMQAAKQGKALPGGAMVQLSRTIEGRRTLSTIREISAQVIIQRREFGLTPASNTKVDASLGGGAGGYMDALEAKLCG